MEARDYNMALHFSKRLTMALDPSSKARSFATVSRSSASKNDKFELLVAFHGNSMAKYSVQAKKSKNEEIKQEYELAQNYGALECHKQGVRGVAVAANDQLFATNSFDSVKVWSVDLYRYA